VWNTSIHLHPPCCYIPWLLVVERGKQWTAAYRTLVGVQSSLKQTGHTLIPCTVHVAHLTQTEYINRVLRLAYPLSLHLPRLVDELKRAHAGFHNAWVIAEEGADEGINCFMLHSGAH